MATPIKINPKQQICTVANYLYVAILRFEKNKLTSKQRKLVKQLKTLIELSVGHAKFSTQTLADFSGKKVEVIFDKTKDYAEDIKKASKKIKGDLKLENMEFKKPDAKWSKYSLVNHYEKAYNVARLIEDTLEDKKKFEAIMRSVERGYYMAYRICSKLKEYQGNASKDKHSLTFYANRFRKLNTQRASRTLVKEEGNFKYFSDGSIWNIQAQKWDKLSNRPIEHIDEEYFDG